MSPATRHAAIVLHRHYARPSCLCATVEGGQQECAGTAGRIEQPSAGLAVIVHFIEHVLSQPSRRVVFSQGMSNGSGKKRFVERPEQIAAGGRMGDDRRRIVAIQTATAWVTARSNSGDQAERIQQKGSPHHGSVTPSSLNKSPLEIDSIAVRR